MKSKIKQIAVQMATEHGLMNLSREDLCKRVGIPNGSFVHYAGVTFTEFLNEMKETNKNLYVVHKRRANPGMRKKQILDHAIQLTREHGVDNITRAQIAEAAGVSMGLINVYYGTMKQLRRDILRHGK